MMKRKKRINQKNSIIPDYEIFKQEVTSKLRSGKGLTGEVGVLTGLINRIVIAAFEGETTEHLSQTGVLRRNQYTKKTSSRSAHRIAGKWKKNWTYLTPFFGQPEAICRTIYTTNSVGSTSPLPAQNQQDKVCFHHRTSFGKAIIFDPQAQHPKLETKSAMLA